ncbi:hypothetical protein M0R45_005667 [Rubus argutus]|uniref:Uncharacterized protein n=1 Tax=Rubus argutus TaxID=59490 RepID=A0AAW1YND0_RUBAR
MASPDRFTLSDCHFTLNQATTNSQITAITKQSPLPSGTASIIAATHGCSATPRPRLHSQPALPPLSIAAQPSFYTAQFFSPAVKPSNSTHLSRAPPSPVACTGVSAAVPLCPDN